MAAPPSISKTDWKSRDAQRVWTSKMGPCKHCGENHLHSQCRRMKGQSCVIPIGYCCPTAEFLKTAGVRRTATPLDWSKSTVDMWAHMLGDGGQALADGEQVATHQQSGKAYHRTYCGPLFQRAECWLHGHDPPTWARRCERLRELLHEVPAGGASRTKVLALHIDFENATDAAEAEGAGLGRLESFSSDLVALGIAADALAGANLHICAVLFVPLDGCSAAKTDVATGEAEPPEPPEQPEPPAQLELPAQLEPPEPPAELEPPAQLEPPGHPGQEGQGSQGGARRLLLTPIGDGEQFASFACVRPRPNVTLLRYVVPHSIRNGAGNPLPKGQNALLAEDAERVHAVLRWMFPEHFPAAHALAPSPHRSAKPTANPIQ